MEFCAERSEVERGAREKLSERKGREREGEREKRTDPFEGREVEVEKRKRPAAASRRKQATRNERRRKKLGKMVFSLGGGRERGEKRHLHAPYIFKREGKRRFDPELAKRRARAARGREQVVKARQRGASFENENPFAFDRPEEQASERSLTFFFPLSLLKGAAALCLLFSPQSRASERERERAVSRG